MRKLFAAPAKHCTNTLESKQANHYHYCSSSVHPMIVVRRPFIVMNQYEMRQQAYDHLDELTGG
jgi:hypothetical protein